MIRGAMILAVGLFGAHLVIAEEKVKVDPLYRSLYADRKAFRPGDILTVIITEVSAASETARTRTDKSDSVSAKLRQSRGEDFSIDLNLSNDFSGGGQIQRTGRLLGKLSVLVESIAPNGNLTIRGEQDIKINNEKQRIALTGIVRSDDINSDNTVVSWRIADAQIDFIGKGVLARNQRPGLLSRLFSLFGLN
jgi:flagellar L-ring protein precursor FlgH